MPPMPKYQAQSRNNKETMKNWDALRKEKQRRIYPHIPSLSFPTLLVRLLRVHPIESLPQPPVAMGYSQFGFVEIPGLVYG